MRSIAMLAACAAVALGALPTMVHAQTTTQTTQGRGQQDLGEDQGQLEPDQGRREGAVGQAHG